MKNIRFITIISAIFIIMNLHYFFNGAFEWYVMEFSYILSITVLLLTIFKLIDPEKVNQRALTMCFVIYSFIDLALYWPLTLNIIDLRKDKIFYNIEIISIYVMFQFSISLIILFYINSKKYFYYGDPYNPKNIFLCIPISKKTRFIFSSLIGAPFGTMCVYANNNLYRFKFSHPTFLKQKYSVESVKQKYFLYDTGIETEQRHIKKLDSLVGEPATNILFLRCKCIYILKDFLGMLGDGFKPSLLEFIPSMYIKKLLRIKKNAKKKFV